MGGEPIKLELVTQRIREMSRNRDHHVGISDTAAPDWMAAAITEAELDLL